MVFIAVLGTLMGVVWWAYTFLNDILAPFLKIFALDGLLGGMWLMGGTFFGYIIRKRGSALLGEVIAAVAQGFISRWGVSSLIYGLIQGLPVELYFLITKYKKWSYLHMIIAGVLSAICSYALTFFWYGYFNMNIIFNIIQIICYTISGVIFPGICAKLLADKLRKANVLNQFNISKDNTPDDTRQYTPEVM